MPVAKILSPELTDSDLGEVLSCAKKKGYHLLYWGTGPDRVVPLHLLGKFSGSLVDKKATYQLKLDSNLTVVSPRDTSTAFTVREYPQSPADQQLLDLALLGGNYSRFLVDPHISRDKFERLYHIWINRSTLHEIADVVYVAVNSSTPQEYHGMVTCSAKQTIGKVGLIGVRKESQGQGIGSLLIKTAHQWMESKKVRLAEMVTQKDNEPACQLYENCGYSLVSLRHYYHFWVQL